MASRTTLHSAPVKRRSRLRPQENRHVHRPAGLRDIPSKTEPAEWFKAPPSNGHLGRVGWSPTVARPRLCHG